MAERETSGSTAGILKRVKKFFENQENLLIPRFKTAIFILFMLPLINLCFYDLSRADEELFQPVPPPEPVFEYELTGNFCHHPTMVEDGKGGIWVAWYTSDEPEGWFLQEKYFRYIQARHLDPKTNQWGPVLKISSTFNDLLFPILGKTNENQIWAFWAEQRSENWDIFAAELEGAKVVDMNRISMNLSSDFSPVTATSEDGTLWVVWQSQQENGFDILARPLQDGTWKEIVPITQDRFSDWSPSVCPAKGGGSTTDNSGIWVAWDSFQGSSTAGQYGNYEIFLAKLNRELKLSSKVQVTKSPYDDINPRLATDNTGRVWLCWERSSRMGENSHRLEEGKTLMLRCYDPEKNSFGILPLEDNKTGWVPILRTSMPDDPSAQIAPCSHQILIDDQNNIHIVYRFLELNLPLRQGWGVFKNVYRVNSTDGIGHWEGRKRISGHAGLDIDVPAVGFSKVSGGAGNPNAKGSSYSVYAYQTAVFNERLSSFRNSKIYFNSFIACGATAPLNKDPEAQNIEEGKKFPLAQAALNKIEIKPFDPASEEEFYEKKDPPKPTDSSTTDIRPFIRKHDQRVNLYWGDLRRHSSLSQQDSMSDGDLWRNYRWMIDHAGFDFGCVTNDFRTGNWYTLTLSENFADLFTSSNTFIPLYGWFDEFYPPGEIYFYYSDRTIGRYLAAAYPSRVKVLWQFGYNPVTELFKALKPFLLSSKLLAVPCNQPVLLADQSQYLDPDFESCLHILDVHSLDFEWSEKMQQSGKFGFIAGSDHGSIPAFALNCRTGVWAEELDRTSILEALKERRSYITNGHPIVLKFTADDHFMGEEYFSSKPPELKIEVKGTTLLTDIFLLRDERVIMYKDPEGTNSIEFSFIDQGAPPGNHKYLVCALQTREKGQRSAGFALSSPIWITLDGTWDWKIYSERNSEWQEKWKEFIKKVQPNYEKNYEILPAYLQKVALNKSYPTITDLENASEESKRLAQPAVDNVDFKKIYNDLRKNPQDFNSSLETRRAPIDRLGATGNLQSARMLIQYLMMAPTIKEDEYRPIADALINCGENALIPISEVLVQHHYDDVGYILVKVLENISSSTTSVSPKAVEMLWEILKNHPGLPAVLESAFALIRIEKAVTPQANETLSKMISLLGSGSNSGGQGSRPLTSYACIKALGGDYYEDNKYASNASDTSVLHAVLPPKLLDDKIISEAIPALTTIVKLRHFPETIAAVETLGKIEGSGSPNDLGAVSIFRYCLSWGDVFLRCASLEGLGNLGSNEDVKLILTNQYSNSPLIKAKAYEALGKIGFFQVAEIISDALSDEKESDLDVRLAILKALQEINTRSTLPLPKEVEENIIFALKGGSTAGIYRNSRIRLAAAQTLAQINPKRAKEELTPLALQDDSSAVRASLKNIIEELEK